MRLTCVEEARKRAYCEGSKGACVSNSFASIADKAAALLGIRRLRSKADKSCNLSIGLNNGKRGAHWAQRVSMAMFSRLMFRAPECQLAIRRHAAPSNQLASLQP